MPLAPFLEPRATGVLVSIGGSEDIKGRTEILDRVADETLRAASQRGDCRLVIVPTATKRRDSEAADDYSSLFLARGVESVEVAPLFCRREAQDPDTAEMIRGSAGIFFTGGDQVRITGLIGGTACGDAVYDVYIGGGVIAGTSAGASAMSENMVMGGDPDPAPHRGAVRMCPGLGLLSGVIIDQHFSQRRRIGRLVTVVSQNPRVLGLGIDENTAVLILPDGLLEVLGEGTVTIFDGTEISHTNIHDLEAGGPMSVADLKIHILLRGDIFDLRKRSLVASAVPR